MSPRSLLVMQCSLNGANGKSNQLVADFVAKYRAKNAGTTIVTRDLAENSLPHLTGAEMGAWMTPADKRSAEQQKLAKISDDLIAEYVAADAIVIGLPMYNFGVPSTFKAWLDRLARAGVTFKYTEKGPVPLVAVKKVYVLCARGGVYEGTAMDTQTPYLKSIMGLIGQTNLEFIYAEGINMGLADKAIGEAKAKIDKVASA